MGYWRWSELCVCMCVIMYVNEAAENLKTMILIAFSSVLSWLVLQGTESQTLVSSEYPLVLLQLRGRWASFDLE